MQFNARVLFTQRHRTHSDCVWSVGKTIYYIINNVSVRGAIAGTPPMPPWCSNDNAVLLLAQNDTEVSWSPAGSSASRTQHRRHHHPRATRVGARARSACGDRALVDNTHGRGVFAVERNNENEQLYGLLRYQRELHEPRPLGPSQTRFRGKNIF